jgi:hypothetical protein
MLTGSNLISMELFIAECPDTLFNVSWSNTEIGVESLYIAAGTWVFFSSAALFRVVLTGRLPRLVKFEACLGVPVVRVPARLGQSHHWTGAGRDARQDQGD